MRRLKAGWVMWRSSAAREKLPLSTRARESSSQERFSDIRRQCFQCIEDEQNGIGVALAGRTSFALSIHRSRDKPP